MSRKTTISVGKTQSDATYLFQTFKKQSMQVLDGHTSVGRGKGCVSSQRRVDGENEKEREGKKKRAVERAEPAFAA